ncbi:MAG: GH1 family beta-glucosidase [Actinomycetaceae bacterium]|nr:GH1 family beta-glucosidase [Actinomycetaceae bacterium]
MQRYEFPPEFQFGAATAAAQIEGAGHEDGKTDSIWDAYCRTPGNIIDGSNIEVACDHYHRMEEDVALIKRLNLDMYRFSISWARVRPDDRDFNALGIDFYSRLVDELLANDITPWITLYHWDEPRALLEQGGWANRDTAYRFAEYAARVYEELGDRVEYWTTLNEPWCSSFLSYAAGIHAPGYTDPKQAVAAAHHLLLGHGLAAKEIRSRADGKPLSLGITLNFTVAHPADPNSAADHDAARQIDGAHNRIFLDPLLRGSYPADVCDDMREAGLDRVIRDGDLDIISQPLDVLGVNFYNGVAVAGPSGSEINSTTPYVGAERIRTLSRGLPVTDMGWEVLADDLRELLIRLDKEYTGPAGIPIFITENGAAYPDVCDETGFVDDTHTRLAYIRDHLIAVHEAIGQGVDINGYFAWSLMDNFEWTFGYTKRFGIVRVDYETGARTPKASAHWYARTASRKGFDAPA